MVNQLTKSVFQNVVQSNYKSSFLEIGTAEFASGILPYFVKNIKYPIYKLLRGMGHEKLYKEEFQRLVLNLCESVEFEFKRTVGLFKLFIYTDESLFVDDDQSIKFWLENIEVCKTVNSRQIGIRRELYKLLKDKYPKPDYYGCCGFGSSA